MRSILPTGFWMAAAVSAYAIDPGDFAPSPGAQWHGGFCEAGTELVRVGDINGDRRDDLVAFDGNRVLVLFAGTSGRSFDGPVDWSTHPLPPGVVPEVGDVDGDGFDDLVYFHRDAAGGDRGAVDAVFGARNGFGERVRLCRDFCTGPQIPALGDVTGDGKVDLIAFTPGGDGAVRVARSNGRAAADSPHIWALGFLGPGQIPLVADFDGNGADDLALFVRESDGDTAHHVYVARAAGDSFHPKARWHDHFCVGDEIPCAGDADGDGCADIFTFVRGRPDPARPDAADPAGDVYVALSQARPNGGGRHAFGPGIRRHTFFGLGDEVTLVGRFDKDNRADLCTLARNTVDGPGRGAVYVACSTFGQLHTWEARIAEVEVGVADESGGDDPRFILYGFRARAGDPGSVEAWASDPLCAGWPDDVARGRRVQPPAAAARLVFPRVAALTGAEILGGRMPEAAGFLIVAVDSDNTSDANIRAQIRTCLEMARAEIAAAVRANPVDRADPWPGIREFTRSVARAAQAAIGGRYTAAELAMPLNDEDDLVASHLFFYPTVDPDVLPRIGLPPTIDFGTRTLTEQTWDVRERPLVFSGNGSVWRTQLEIRRSDPPERPGRAAGAGTLRDDLILNPTE